MVPWWKRLLFSLVSLFMASALCLAAVVAQDAFKGHPGSIHSSEVILTMAVMGGFCVVAWVVSAPVVLVVKNIRGWRFWFYFLAGSSVGPLLMLGLAGLIFIVFPQGPNAKLLNPALTPLLYLSGAVSTLTSIFYLLLLRHGTAQSARK